MTAGQTTDSTVDSEPDVLTLLRRQAVLFNALGSLSQSQREAIEEGPADAVISLLAKRQQVVEQLTGLATELEPYRRQWASTRAALGSWHRDEVDRVVAESEQSLQEILDRDDHDRALLLQFREKAGEELSRINRSGQALSAYAPPPPAGMNRYTDRSG